MLYFNIYYYAMNKDATGRVLNMVLHCTGDIQSVVKLSKKKKKRI